MSEPRVIYNGVPMIANWPARIEAAQLHTHYGINGKDFLRIRFGEEAEGRGAKAGPCHDCRVLEGQLHVVGCDVELCPNCGGQMISCDCDYEGDEE